MRDKTLDWPNSCRVIAIFGVILIHACGGFFYQYGKIPLSDWLSADFIDALVRSAVPVFVMLSGALLLKDEMPAQVELKAIFKRALKVIVPLITWSYIYLVYIAHFAGSGVHLKSIFFAPATYHLWFVYMIIGLYLLLPFLNIVYVGIKDNRALKRYFFSVWLMINVLPLYVNIPFLTLMYLTQFLGYGGYFILGALLARSNDIKKRSTLFFAGLYSVSSLITFFATWWYSFEANAPVEKAYVYFSINVFLAAIGAFVLLQKMTFSARYNRLFAWLSDKCFIIYFAHVLVLEKVRYNPHFMKLTTELPAFFTIFMLAILVFTLSAGLAGLIRLTVRNKYVFG